MKIVLFGGSFDPVHKGHLAIAEEACRCCRFDRFFFVPAALSPFKHPGSVSASLRLRMLEDALKEVPCLPAEIDRSEISRGAPSSTGVKSAAALRRIRSTQSAVSAAVFPALPSLGLRVMTFYPICLAGRRPMN